MDKGKTYKENLDEAWSGRGSLSGAFVPLCMPRRGVMLQED